MSDNGFIKEYARLQVVDARGITAPAIVPPVFVDISGPVVEAAKSLEWAVTVIERDGGKVIDVKFGTLQAGEFRERVERKVPLFVNGFRRMASFLQG